MSLLGAFTGGFSSMFSIWVFCLMQVIPFFLAFVVGSAFLFNQDRSFGERWKADLALGLVVTGGFMVIFAPMGMPTTMVSKLIYKYIYLGNQFGGLMTGLIALFFIGILTFSLSPGALRKAAIALGLLFGMTLALAYKPCVTPTLTMIFNISRIPDSSGQGGALLIAYSLGFFTVINSLAMIIIWTFSRLGAMINGSLVRKLAGAVLLAYSFMIIAGYMTTYKSWLVGGFVEEQMGHQGHDMGKHKMDMDGSGKMDHKDH